MLLFRSLVILLPLSLSFLTSGCVIPVSPDFQDPAGGINYPPVLRNPSPGPFGTLVNIVATPTNPNAVAQFSAVVLDQNQTDIIYYQWVFDPTSPFQGAVTRALGVQHIPPPLDGSQQRSIPPQPVSCGLGPSMNSTSSHQVELIVSDVEPVFHATGPFDDVPAPGFVVYGNWPIYMPCDGSSTGSP